MEGSTRDRRLKKKSMIYGNVSINTLLSNNVRLSTFICKCCFFFFFFGVGEEERTQRGGIMLFNQIFHSSSNRVTVNDGGVFSFLFFFSLSIFQTFSSFVL